MRCSLDGLESACLGRIIAAGETIGSTFAFTGKGVGTAMDTGDRASQAVDEALASGDPGCLASYPAGLSRDLAGIFSSYSAAQKWVAKGWTNDLMARRMAVSPFLRGKLSAVLAGEALPREVFSVKAVLASFFR
jgi:flavin-dependent dehydrogenase